MSNKFFSTKCFGYDLLNIFPWLFRNLFGLVPLLTVLCWLLCRVVDLLCWLLYRIPDLLGFLFVFPFRRPSLIFMLLPELLIIGWWIANATFLNSAEGLKNAARFFLSIIPVLVLRGLGVIFFLVQGMIYMGNDPPADGMKQQFFGNFNRYPTDEELDALCTPEEIKELTERREHAWYYRGEATFYVFWLLYYVGMGLCCYLEYHGKLFPMDTKSCLLTLLTWPFTPFMILSRFFFP